METELRKLLRNAENGDASAQQFLGMLYSHGSKKHLLKQDGVEGAKWSRKAAEQGDADGQYDLAVAYRVGRGVPQDYVEALSWYRKAAEQGDSRAQVAVGEAYDTALGVRQDRAQALEWYRKAAEQGDTNAQEYLDGYRRIESTVKLRYKRRPRQAR